MVYELIFILVRRVLITLELVHTALLRTRTLRDRRACAYVSVRVRGVCACVSVRVRGVPTRADTSAAAVLLEVIAILIPCWGGQALGGRRAGRWRALPLAAAEVTDEGGDDDRLAFAVAKGGVKRRSAQAEERGEHIHRKREAAGVICAGEVTQARQDLQDALAHIKAIGAVGRFSPSCAEELKLGAAPAANR